jgi:hypothetical protein
VAPFDRVHNIEDGEMDDGHRPARPAWPKLMAEDVGGVRRRMVEPGGIDGNLVPITDRNSPIEDMAGAMFRVGLNLLDTRMDPRAKRLTEPAA